MTDLLRTLLDRARGSNTGPRARVQSRFQGAARGAEADAPLETGGFERGMPFERDGAAGAESSGERVSPGSRAPSVVSPAAGAATVSAGERANGARLSEERNAAQPRAVSPARDGMRLSDDVTRFAPRVPQASEPRTSALDRPSKAKGEPANPLRPLEPRRSDPPPTRESGMRPPTYARVMPDTRPAETRDTGPTEVHIHIGRLEIRSPAPNAAERKQSAPRRPALSLDAYLAQRRGTER